MDDRRIISENLDEINANIGRAAAVAGRQQIEVLLVGVTKKVEVDKIQILYDLGMSDFGENRVQVFIDKYENLPKDIKWHFIGSLQKNKVKYVVGKVVLIHSVDSFELLQEIDRQGKKHGIVQDVLLEVNIANEPSKHGFSEKDVRYAVEKAEAAFAKFEMVNVNIRGLMCMAPFVEDKEDTRQYFRALRILAEDIAKVDHKVFKPDFLSMGMTNDYEIAIEEGANIVRIGTAMFRDIS